MFKLLPNVWLFPVRSLVVLSFLTACRQGLNWVQLRVCSLKRGLISKLRAWFMTERITFLITAHAKIRLCVAKKSWFSSLIFADLALKQPTKQSSSRHGGIPERAVDGLKSSYFEHNSCTRTKALQKPPWWRVDLGSSLPVAEVIVVNRACAGDCARRLKEFEIRVGKSLKSFVKAQRFLLI